MKIARTCLFVIVSVTAPTGRIVVAAPSPSCVPNPLAKIQPSTQTVAEGASVGLNGAPSKGDAFVWSQTSGPAVTLTGADQQKAAFEAPGAPPAGATLVFTLTVTGCNGVTASAQAVVNVTNVNQAPLAVAAASPSTVAEGQSFTLDGSASRDPDGDALAYGWEQRLPDGTWASVAAQATVQVTAPVSVPYPGGVTVTFRLTVSDGALTSTAQQLVSVTWVNDPPVAAASCTATADEGQQIVLDAGGSTDDDGDGIAGYEWAQLTGGPTASVATGALSLPLLSFEAPRLAHGQGDTMTFAVTVTDAGGLSSAAECAVQVRDVTPPVITAPAGVTAEATSSAGAEVTYVVSAADGFDGEVPVGCVPPSGSAFPLDETTTVMCLAADAAGNEATVTFGVTVVDTTPPAVTVPADVVTGPTLWNGAPVTYGAASATDLVDGELAVECLPASGSVFGFGPTIVTCSATDAHFNHGAGSFTVTVRPFTVRGFFAPVDLPPALNNVKNGATVPVKWALEGEGGLDIADVAALASAAVTQLQCGALASALETVVELTTTGGTALRYDPTARQFILNWQTPKQPGTCWRLELGFTDGTGESANFKLR